MINVKNLVFKRISFGNERLLLSPQTRHIAFGIDANFALGLGVLITSIHMHNKRDNFVFHIFTDGIQQKDISRLEKLAQETPDIMIRIYYIDKQGLNDLPTGFIWTVAMYYRFLISEELYGTVDRVLYLDADILCINSVAKMFSLDLEGNIIGAVEDLVDKTEVANRLFQGETTAYFASGLLLIDINKWKQENITEKLIIKLRQENNYKFYDQDVLNQVLHDKTKFLAAEYHYIYNVSFMTQSVPENAIFIHFAGTAKPWHSWAQAHPLVQTYLKYKAQSLWADEPIVEAATYKQAKFMARFYKRNQQNGRALVWYIKYGLWKMIGKK